MESKKQTSAFDAKIGDNVRKRRMSVGLTQERLGEILGLTFQQIQKYEKGINRISAGRLFEVSAYLNLPIQTFFEDLSLVGDIPQGFAESNEPSETSKFLMSAEGHQVGAAFSGIKNAKVRKRLIELMRSLGSEPEEP